MEKSIEDKVLAYIDQGIACKERGDYEDAIKNYNEAIKLDSNSLRAYGNRGNAYKGIATKKKDKGYYTDAIEYYGKAIDDFEKVKSLDKNNVNVYNSLGSAYAGKSTCFECMKNGNTADQYKKISADESYNKAIEYYEKAIERDPNSVVVYINRGNAHLERVTTYLERNFEKAKYDEAIEDYKEAIKLGNDEAIKNSYEAIKLDMDKKLKFDKAFKNSYEAIKLDIDEAIRNYASAINRDPNCVDVDATTFCDLGSALSYKGNYSRSINANYEAIRYYGEAIDARDKAIKLNPNFVDAYHYKGNAYFQIAGAYLDKHDCDSALAEGYNKAIECYEKALSLDKNNENVKQCLKVAEDFKNRTLCISIITKATLFQKFKRFVKTILRVRNKL